MLMLGYTYGLCSNNFYSYYLVDQIGTMNSQYSLCDKHRQEVKYFCAAEACYYLPLCDSCCNEHQEVHAKLQLIPLKKALLMAESNLRRQEREIEKYLNPLKIRENMIKTIQAQKQALEREKQRLIQFIVDKIDAEIKLLQTSNETDFNREEVNVKKALEFKIQEIYSLGSPTFDGKISSLRKALNFQIDHFMQQTISKHNQLLHKNPLMSNRSSKFKVYQSTHHEIMISPLDLRQRAHEKTRQIKRVMNESPLYFLIDPNLSTSNIVYSLSPQQKRVYTYNADYDDWSSTHISTDFLRQGAAVHDYKRNRLFWIGGYSSEENYNRSGSGQYGNRGISSQRSDRIFVYEPDNKENNWRYLRCKLTIPRSSCQATIVQDKNDPNNYGIVIAGGLGPNGQVLKSTEYLDLTNQTVVLLSETNFGAYSGTLVTYNKTNVLRIGGLYKNRADIAVVETVERLDCAQWLQLKTAAPRWRYVELMVPEYERSQKLTLFNANQAAIQINPNQIFVFGGITSGLKGVADSFIIGVEQFDIESRSIGFDVANKDLRNSGLRQSKKMKQYKFTVRWANEKPLISGDDFGGQCPSLWKGRLHVVQNMGSQDLMISQKRLLCFNMYQWSEIQDALPE